MNKIQELTLAELNRQLKRKQDELRALEHLAEWGDQAYRWGIAQCRQQIVKLNAAIERTNAQ